MNSFSGDNFHYEKQLIWTLVSTTIFFIASFIDWGFLKRTQSVMVIYGIVCFLLLLLFSVSAIKGAKGWFNLGLFSVQPADMATLSLILVLSKYFSKRHVEIAHFKHIIVSGVYAFILAILIALQPDFGGAIIISCIWFGMTLVSGISKKHLLALFALGIVAFGFLWGFGFKDYQKARVMTFVNPMSDIRGSGYHVYQSTIAVGSGEVLGKGIGYGTQSRLKFLPEYQTDFIFAAFVEEWGLVGALILFGVFTLLIVRITSVGVRGGSNFEILFGFGLATLLTSHFIINAGMNIGILPVTGITFPFMSYGGSHLVMSFFALGILNSMQKRMKHVHREQIHNELVGVGHERV
jgi:rod shape determining protein RodA